MKNYRVGSSLEGLETLIEGKDFRSDRFWYRLEPWVWVRLRIRVFAARSFFQRSHESRHASHSKGRHGRCHNGDASSMRKDLCGLSKDKVRCLCWLDKQWLSTGTVGRLCAHDLVHDVWCLLKMSIIVSICCKSRKHWSVGGHQTCT
jgi:hypothetical protein